MWFKIESVYYDALDLTIEGKTPYTFKNIKHQVVNGRLRVYIENLVELMLFINRMTQIQRDNRQLRETGGCIVCPAKDDEPACIVLYDDYLE